MKELQGELYNLLFMGFTVEHIEKLDDALHEYKKYKITGVRLYSIKDSRVINESIKYFTEHLYLIRHTMRMSRVGKKLEFNRVNEALAYLLTTHKYIVVMGYSNKVALSTDRDINHAIKGIFAIEKHKVHGVEAFIGYYSKRNRLLYGVDSLKMKSIKVKEMPIEVYEFFKDRHFFKSIDTGNK